MGYGVSVVVPTRNRRERVLASIEPLFDDPMVREVIVVVDGSRDGTYEMLLDRGRESPALRPVWQHHSGAGAARQRGCELASSDIVLLLDDDVVPSKGLASGHLAAHTGRDDLVVVGRMVTPRAARVHRDSATTDLYRLAYAYAERQYERDPATILDHLWMGNLSIRRTRALQVGVYDPEMSALYFEDRDFGLRLKRHGAVAVYRPSLVAEHEYERTLRAFAQDAVRQGRALIVLHERYPELIPAPTACNIAGRAPRPARWVVDASARNAALGSCLVYSLISAAHTLGTVRAHGQQLLVLTLLQRVGQATGAATARQNPGRTATRQVDDVADLLLPELPAYLATPRPDGPAPHVPSATSTLSSPLRTVFARSAKSVLAAGATTAVVIGGRPSRALRSEGYETTEYRLRRWWSGAAVLVPRDSRGVVGEVASRSLLPRRRRLRRRLGNVAWFGPRRVTVAARATGPPAVVAAAVGREARLSAVVFDTSSPRRRAAFIVAAPSAPTAVVKVGHGRDAPPRAEREQQMLGLVHASGIGDPAPRPLGHGILGELAWSSETLVHGIPLADLLAASSRGSARQRTLDQVDKVHAWLCEVGAATAQECSWSLGEGDIVLAGSWLSLAELRRDLDGVPAVLQHGDLATAFNILMADDSFAIIDWETATRGGLPLADSLPLLCAVLTALRAPVGEQSEYMLRLCEGRAPESEWLFARLRTYCRRVGVPRRSTGALAALAFARQASLESLHVSLVERAARRVPRWDSMWGGVSAGWMSRPLLGLEWSALGDATS